MEAPERVGGSSLGLGPVSFDSDSTSRPPAIGVTETSEDRSRTFVSVTTRNEPGMCPRSRSTTDWSLASRSEAVRSSDPQHDDSMTITPVAEDQVAEILVLGEAGHSLAASASAKRSTSGAWVLDSEAERTSCPSSAEPGDDRTSDVLIGEDSHGDPPSVRSLENRPDPSRPRPPHNGAPPGCARA